MSYSSEVKNELIRVIPEARHCKIAELTAIISLLGRISISEDDKFRIYISTEHSGVARKCFTLLKKTYNIGTDISISRSNFLNRKRLYTVSLKNDEDSRRVLEGSKLVNRYGEIEENLSLKENVVVSGSCCRRAFLRGAFLAAGSISDPEKSYHFEIVCPSMEKAQQLQGMICSFGPEAKVVARKKAFVVYLKESEQIVEFLGLMEAPGALMELENIRILKDMRNNVNRKVNCETANINKTVSAAVRQIEDIEFIRDSMGLENLAESLRSMAVLRLENPEAALKELGELLEPPVGKSGVNHRLRKLSEIADKLRNEE